MGLKRALNCWPRMRPFTRRYGGVADHGDLLTMVRAPQHAEGDLRTVEGDAPERSGDPDYRPAPGFRMSRAQER